MAHTNAQIIAGADSSALASAYRELVSIHGHDALCDAYGLDRDDVDGGTHWTDVIAQALAWGDINRDGTLN